MKRKVGDYSKFVNHPRYGRGPRFTDVRPREKPLGYRLTTYISDGTIGGTAVEADLDRQIPSPVPVLYYFDLTRVCVECHRPFIFFAEEQKYWYESLGFVLDADCIRCVECRRLQQGLDRRRQRYEELFRREERSAEENLEMAECCLDLVEGGVFHGRHTERVRMLLNKFPQNQGDAVARRIRDLRDRLPLIEAGRSGHDVQET
ncbi:zinc-ribbon domain containing protein [Candidatus Laterigemmans baculatus]|uniref:zinc-ribbon domain containing protein n=1 Tax=Candidatus Laterigemmans baculatus TaxID=2770505 RepID=UPI0013D92D2A|nr:zinc-ribbon domain containing protein [Candidatus Laterigemmans baculatus]